MSEKAARILKEQWFCVLGTASPDGVPWVSPVFYNYDSTYRLVWESARDAYHSKLIAANPAIAVVVANFETKAADEAVYLTCRAREVPPEGLTEALEVFLNGAHPRTPDVPRSVDLYAAAKPLRLYEATIESAYLLTVMHDAEGHRVDRRQEIDLQAANH